MKTYTVRLEELLVTVVRITAKSKEEAEKLVLSGRFAEKDVVSKEINEGYINLVNE